MERPLALEDFLTVLAETMKFATQALAQQAALVEILLRKGVVTKEELDAQVKLRPPQTKTLLDMLGKFSPDKPKPS